MRLPWWIAVALAGALVAPSCQSGHTINGDVTLVVVAQANYFCSDVPGVVIKVYDEQEHLVRQVKSDKGRTVIQGTDVACKAAYSVDVPDSNFYRIQPEGGKSERLTKAELEQSNWKVDLQAEVSLENG